MIRTKNEVRILLFLICGQLVIACNDNVECESYSKTAKSYLGSKDFQKSIELSNISIYKCPKSKEGYYIRGLSYYSMQEFEKALRDFKSVTDIDSINTTGLYYIGLTYFYLEKDDSSVFYYNKAIATKGTDTLYMEFNKPYKELFEDISMPLLRYKRGVAFYQLNNYSRALEDFEFALRHEIYKETCFLYIGLIALEKGNLRIACKYLQEAIKYGNKNAVKYLPQNCDTLSR